MDLMRQHLAGRTLLATTFTVFTVLTAVAGEVDAPRGHTKISGVVMEKGGRLVLMTPGGAMHQINANISERHGHAPFKAGDEVVGVLDENNYIIDMHLKGEEGQHQLVTGKLVKVGVMKNHIKLQTADGEKIFPLTEQAQKTKVIPDGALVTVELNEAGAVIDLHQADPSGGKNVTTK